MNFHWDVTLGNVLSFAGMVVAFFVAHSRGVKRLAEMETKVDLMFQWWKRHLGA